MSLFALQRNEFKSRHIGPSQEATAAMLKTIGESSLDSLIDKTVPNAIRMQSPLNLPAPMHEAAYLQHVQEMGSKNIVAKKGNIFPIYIADQVKMISSKGGTPLVVSENEDCKVLYTQ